MLPPLGTDVTIVMRQAEQFAHAALVNRGLRAQHVELRHHRVDVDEVAYPFGFAADVVELFVQRIVRGEDVGHHVHRGGFRPYLARRGLQPRDRKGPRGALPVAGMPPQSSRSSRLALLQMMSRMSSWGTPSKSRLMTACEFGNVVSECG